MTATRTRLTGAMSHRLKTARLEAGYTQQDIANGTGLSLKSVNNYENPRYVRKRTPYAVKVWAELCGRTYADVAVSEGQEISRLGWNGGRVTPGTTSKRANAA